MKGEEAGAAAAGQRSAVGIEDRREDTAVEPDAKPWTGPDDWLETVLAPVAVAGSVVIVANCADEAVLERRMSQERATVRR